MFSQTTVWGNFVLGGANNFAELVDLRKGMGFCVFIWNI